MSTTTGPERLALTVVPGAGWTAADIGAIAREAEEVGFDAIFTTEVNNDAMATAQLMGAVTEQILVGTWIANIYLRHPYVCAQGAALIADATGGRFVLGLGVSHQPVNTALGIDMTNAADDLQRYVTDVRNWLDGDGPTTHLPQRPSAQRVPIHVAALTSRMIERAAEVADGIMPTFWSPERVERARTWTARGRARSPELGPLEITLGLPTFPGEDLDALHETARQNLGLYTYFPFFQNLFRASGFPVEADAMERGAGPGALSDVLLDSFCLIGTVEHCRERLSEYRAAGVDLPILNPAIGVEAARDLIHTFARQPIPAGREPAMR